MRRTPIGRALLDTRFDTWITPLIIRTIYLLTLWAGGLLVLVAFMWWIWLASWFGWMWYFMLPVTLAGGLGGLLAVRVCAEMVLIRWVRTGPRPSGDTRPDVRRQSGSPASGAMPRSGEIWGAGGGGLWDGTPNGDSPLRTDGVGAAGVRAPEGQPRSDRSSRANGPMGTDPRSGPSEGAGGGGLWDGAGHREPWP
ncbi:hypothetical protein EDD29_6414 [Actinocorallia herbida]|uniref:DUF4282 domain-containing protein n=1 Tax=Actinocorallia herbida TaxID=58109 RepID=A0A3N1D5B3_9ACTN|nr:hypothetical protein EDD29_6414 [Actinocorallia herbida]